MSKYYIYKMEILENDTYFGSYIGQHKIGKKDPSCDGYIGSGSKWKEYILMNRIPVKKTILRICDNVDEANFWEVFYIGKALESGEFLWNVCKGGGNHDYTRIFSDEEIKAHNKERFNRWYAKNQEHMNEYRKKYYKDNKDWLYAQKKQYRENHKEHYSEYGKQYYQKNKERLSKHHKGYYERNKEQINTHNREYWKQYQESHADTIKEKARQYNTEHKEERENYYTRPCCYKGKTLTFRALILRFRRKGIINPTEEAKKYLLKEAI